MTGDDLLSQLRAIEPLLRSAEVQDFCRKQSEDVRDRFVSLRHEISVMINKLSNAELQRLADKLTELSAELTTGIDNLKNKIAKLDNAISILDTISNVLGLVGRVIAFLP